MIFDNFDWVIVLINHANNLVARYYILTFHTSDMKIENVPRDIPIYNIYKERNFNVSSYTI